MAIDTREELVKALHMACEIEHGLMIQYRQAESGPKLSPRAADWQNRNSCCLCGVPAESDSDVNTHKYEIAYSTE